MPTSANLAKIHIAKKELGLSDEDYRGILAYHFQVDSAAKLNDRQCVVMINHLKAKGWKPKSRDKKRGKPFAGTRPAPGRASLLAKIEAQLTVRQLPWSYAASMAKRICKVDALEFCDVEGLRKIVAAFAYDAKRKGLVQK